MTILKPDGQSMFYFKQTQIYGGIKRLMEPFVYLYCSTKYLVVPECKRLLLSSFVVLCRSFIYGFCIYLDL